MSLSWSKEQRQRADVTKQSLFYIAIDGRCNKKGQIGRYEYSGCIPDEGAAELFLEAQKIIAKYREKK